MKLKVVILDQNTEFVNRLAKAFQKKYEDKISLMLFSDEEAMYNSLKNMRADILFSDQSEEIDESRIGFHIVKGCFCDAPDVSEIDGIPAVCRYQKVENIYKSIIGIYAENAPDFRQKDNDSRARVVFFFSAQGGSGTSSAAAAYAMRGAAEGRKIFFLNLERLGDADLYFTGDGNLSFSDVIYALKSRNGNLALKLSSLIQTDPSGVEFFHTCKNAYDMFELKDQETETLLSVLAHMEKYEEIVVDLSGGFTERMIGLMQSRADRIVYIADGSECGNGKFERFCEVVRILEERQEFRILDKMILLYNRYSSRTGMQMEKTAVPVLGGIHRFEGITGRALIREIAKIDVLSRI